MEIIFVTFNVEISKETLSQVLKIEPCFFRWQPQELIKTMFASVRLVHPNCRTVLLTDRVTRFSDLSPSIEIMRFDLDTHNLSLCNTLAQVEFLKTLKESSHVVFLDTDMLVQKSLANLFLKNFEVGLTYRTDRMPINAGIILINGHAIEKGIEFMEHILSLMKKKYINFQTWYANQFALKEFVQIPSDIEEQTRIVQQHHFNILLLPGIKYNFSTHRSLMRNYHEEVVVIHFKGKKKECQLDYFYKYLQ
jgi:hypothetical protein